MKRSLGAFDVAVCAIIGLAQIVATFKGAELWGIPTWAVVAAALFLGPLPLVGTAAGVYGAVYGWGWSWEAALGLFLAIPLISFMTFSIPPWIKSFSGRLLAFLALLVVVATLGAVADDIARNQLGQPPGIAMRFMLLIGGISSYLAVWRSTLPVGARVARWIAGLFVGLVLNALMQALHAQVGQALVAYRPPGWALMLLASGIILLWVIPVLVVWKVWGSSVARAQPRAASDLQIAEKTCPRCAETVKAAALVCRFCGHEFDVALPVVAPPDEPPPSSIPRFVDGDQVRHVTRGIGSIISRPEEGFALVRFADGDCRVALRYLEQVSNSPTAAGRQEPSVGTSVSIADLDRRLAAARARQESK